MTYNELLAAYDKLERHKKILSTIVRNFVELEKWEREFGKDPRADKIKEILVETTEEFFRKVGEP